MSELPKPIAVTVGGLKHGEEPWIDLRFSLKPGQPALDELLRRLFTSEDRK